MSITIIATIIWWRPSITIIATIATIAHSRPAIIGVCPAVIGETRRRSPAFTITAEPASR